MILKSEVKKLTQSTGLGRKPRLDTSGFADSGLQATSGNFCRFASRAQYRRGSTEFSLINFNKSAPAGPINFIM